MKTKKKLLIFLVILVVALLVGALGVLYFEKQKAAQERVEEDVLTGNFSDYTDCENFKDIPAMIVPNTKIRNAVDYGDDTWIIDVNGTTLTDYQEYLLKLEENGFSKHVDNGESGLDEAVYSTTYTKGNMVLTVTQAVKLEKTYIAASKDLPLSEHLIYKDEYVADNKEGAKTTLHMLEMYDTGNSFVIQLKNGHFIVNDGGKGEDLPYLLDYLEALTPDDEKPVIEAWVVSHAHLDHMGSLKALYSENKYSSYTKRIYVEGIYFSEPSEEVRASLYDTAEVTSVLMAAVSLQTTSGDYTPIYRPQMGQRYYFCDVTMDIVFSQEQLILQNYGGDFNDSSTWCMFNIEGQTFLHCGDADQGAIDSVMRIYDSDYFNLDVFAVFHHGINVYDRFTDYCNLKTILYPNYRTASYHTADDYTREAENNHLKESALESMAFGDGTKVLTFPYEIGSAETLDLFKWEYHNGVRGEEILK